ncbi:BsuPI-related putative proteinase inhibitor [Petroclostridium sp. X23]|uniref:BsuPI-related putative proteinase inhibitor n=1 Tax=Petroclostridium sp. X23 TaxID=3045146 RepID=UPI0024AD93D8|nr:BsuPI-related putative proteinase inhibitor [Petroclostridium sp. X23]WHH57219.1 BsuPI-related putative proteinase inhibitor [Petroclostridium sp. X23]
MHVPKKYIKMTDLGAKPQYDAAMMEEGLYESLILNNYQFRRNSLLKILLVKVNLGCKEAELHYNTGQRYEFVIKDRMNTEKWKWSVGKEFVPIDESLALEVGKSKVYSALWRIPKDSEPGIYMLEGWNTAEQLKDKKLKVRFNVIP